jgi:hypothetical protein
MQRYRRWVGAEQNREQTFESGDNTESDDSHQERVRRGEERVSGATHGQVGWEGGWVSPSEVHLPSEEKARKRKQTQATSDERQATTNQGTDDGHNTQYTQTHTDNKQITYGAEGGMGNTTKDEVGENRENSHTKNSPPHAAYSMPSHRVAEKGREHNKSVTEWMVDRGWFPLHGLVPTETAV